jgi:hypothetical protein
VCIPSSSDRVISFASFFRMRCETACLEELTCKSVRLLTGFADGFGLRLFRLSRRVPQSHVVRGRRLGLINYV